MDDRSSPSRTRTPVPPESAPPLSWSPLIAALGVAACSGGDSNSTSRSRRRPLSRATNVDMPLGDVSRPTAPAHRLTVSPEQAQEILDLLTTYVKGATVQPLRSGVPATADFAMMFDPATLAPATTTDRGVVLDEGLPKVTGDLDVVSTPVALLGLGDQAGSLTLVSAAMVLDVKGQTAVEGRPAAHRPPGRLRRPARPASAAGGSPPTAWSSPATAPASSPTTTTTTATTDDRSREVRRAGPLTLAARRPGAVRAAARRRHHRGVDAAREPGPGAGARCGSR